MRTREELLAFLRKVAALERAGGYRNRAVFGGLGKLAPSVEDWSGPPAPEPALTHPAARLLARYGAVPTAERPEWIDRLERILSSAENSEPRVDVPEPKKASVRPPPVGPLTLNCPVTSLRGIKEQTAKLLARLGVRTVEDLVWHLPERHEDRSVVTPIAALETARDATIVARVSSAARVPFGPRKERLEAVLVDESGQVEAVWFNQPWLAQKLKPGVVASFHGAVRQRDARRQLQSAEIEFLRPPAIPSARLVPIYPLTAGLFQRGVRRMAREALQAAEGQVREDLPEELRQRLGFPGVFESLGAIHNPPSQAVLDDALERLRFGELFFLELAVAVKRHLFRDARAGVQCEDAAGLLSRLWSRLPFRLTGAQERAVADILSDLRQPQAMARLVQGDVGSGKTAVALAALVATAGSGWQGALMAPTEILAGQHFLSVRRLCADLGVGVELLVGSQGTRERRASLEAIASGASALAVGTHALFEGDVQFARLGLVVIDEQHRFGVHQRARLKLKGDNPNLLVMTATPIPRTLALTLYGDLDLSVLDEMPPGRQPIRTRALPIEKIADVYAEIAAAVSLGRQAYVVCPLVEESEKLEAEAAEATFEEVRSRWLPGARIELLHGRMPGAVKAQVMEKMRQGAADVLVATTVVEVGVDIPNATVMAVLNAERFGLAQLHQLRGRIGRGAHRSTFYPVVASRSRDVRERMRVLEKSSDGFQVAEKDLEMRGPGEFFGTRQSGLDYLPFALVAQDPDLAAAELAATREQLMRKYGEFVHRRH
ncbi:MAG: ATP-dependent DNA helicase RecG [Candidatus Wallbacteria bacterium]|nr:ATP-dependent DNA helicase RecG [Candidatus Wallbacteria bacterium]